jgi:hypothetical protein
MMRYMMVPNPRVEPVIPLWRNAGQDCAWHQRDYFSTYSVLIRHSSVFVVVLDIVITVIYKATDIMTLLKAFFQRCVIGH